MRGDKGKKCPRLDPVDISEQTISFEEQDGSEDMDSSPQQVVLSKVEQCNNKIPFDHAHAFIQFKIAHM